MIDPITAMAFSVAENPRVFALLLGSGISRAAQVPTGWEITLELTRRIGLLERAGEKSDWSAWYRVRFGEEPSYSKLLDRVAPTSQERRSILHNFIEPTRVDVEEGRKVPTRAHRAIARLVRDGYIRVIITTNFDRLMETALREAGVEPTVVKSDDDAKGALPLIHAGCYVLKLHGDYLDTRIRNTDRELGSYSAVQNRLLARIFDEHGLIVCGWSGEWDTALRAAITRAPNRRFPTFWAMRGDPTDTAQELITHRKAQIVRIPDADALFANLQEKVELQATLGRPDPLSVDLLTASAKRYAGKPEYRAQLGDLVVAEARRARTRIADEGLNVQGPHSVEEFTRRGRMFEAACEPLLGIFYAMGRWGDGSELGLATDVVAEFSTFEVMNGLVLWSELRRYPAVALWYAYGLGATKGERLSLLHQWLVQPIAKSYEPETKAAALSLFQETWGVGEAEWGALAQPPSGNRWISDYFRQLFARQLVREFVSPADFDRTFERFELLGSLAALSVSATRESMEEGFARGDRGHEYTPVGRFKSVGWDGNSRAIAELERRDVSLRLAQAGFGSDWAYVEMALKTIRRAIAYSRRAG